MKIKSTERYSFFAKNYSVYEKTHKKCTHHFVMYGDLYMARGMTGTSYKIKKNVKKIAKKH